MAVTDYKSFEFKFDKCTAHLSLKNILPEVAKLQKHLRTAYVEDTKHGKAVFIY